jgi:hypothetical protein
MSSRDRICQRRDGVVSPSPGRRRLRFSFQINDVKDPTGGFPAPPITPGGARSGVSIRTQIRCQPTLVARIGRSDLSARTAGAARGLPHSVLRESIEGAETSWNMTENQGASPGISVRPPQKLRPSASGGVYGPSADDASAFRGRDDADAGIGAGAGR